MRGDHPGVALEPVAITAQVLEAAGLGATVVHLHAREPDGTASSCADIFADSVGRVREHGELPERLLELGATSGRSPMPPTKFREGLALSPGDGMYGHQSKPTPPSL